MKQALYVNVQVTGMVCRVRRTCRVYRVCRGAGCGEGYGTAHL